MNLRINSRHLEVTPGIRDHLENRLERIRKHFDHNCPTSHQSSIT
ncbi:MAG: hypothetical protein EB139_01755 [Burkholderiaceae bacterium]|nr:hypothetical protein [Burkholderiaceae bacterium]